MGSICFFSLAGQGLSVTVALDGVGFLAFITMPTPPVFMTPGFFYLVSVFSGFYVRFFTCCLAKQEILYISPKFYNIPYIPSFGTIKYCFTFHKI
jgi:hypothetical protein